MKTYKVKLRCRNCNHSWEQDVEKGFFVVEGSGNSKYSGTPITAISRNSDGYMWEDLVECPNCETDNIAKLG